MQVLVWPVSQAKKVYPALGVEGLMGGQEAASSSLQHFHISAKSGRLYPFPQVLPVY